MKVLLPITDSANTDVTCEVVVMSDDRFVTISLENPDRVIEIPMDQFLTLTLVVQANLQS